MSETWSEVLHVLMGGPESTSGELLLRGALAGCTIFALIQLLAMMATRWGDHHAMGKSLLLSLLLHVCLGLGWATVAQQSLPAGSAPAAVDVEAKLTLHSEADGLPAGGSDASVTSASPWAQPIDLPSEATRQTRTAPPADMPIVEVERTTTPPVEMAAAEVPSLNALPETNPAIPEVADPQTVPVASPQPATPSLPLMDTTALTAESRTESTSTIGRTRRSTGTPPTVPTPELGTPEGVEADAAALAAMTPLPRTGADPVLQPLDPKPSAAPLRGDPQGSMNTLPTTPANIQEPTAPTAAPTTASSAGSRGSAFVRGNPAARRGDSTQAAPQIARTEVMRPSPLPARDLLKEFAAPLTTDADASPHPALIPRRPPSAPLGARPPGSASTYRLRSLERRQETALRNGGSRESEKAVEAALAYLARVQEPQGFWDADRHGGGVREVRQIDAGKPSGGTEADTGLTGLAVLAFLGAGYTHEEGEYADEVHKAIQWLISEQRSDGYLGGKATYYDQMYCHGIATYALAEAYGMQSDPNQFPALRDAVSRGVWYIQQTQNSDGGWRYRFGASLSDMSMFGWQLMALKSADLAGIPTPAETRSGMIKFLRERSRGASDGLAGYKQDSPITPAMSAEALFCKQMYGLRRTSPASREATDYLRANLPQLSKPDEYYWYYGTLAMFQYGGEGWTEWNGALRDTLIRLQRTSGDNAGSWDPAGPWGSVGGRIYSTALSTMCLEVYYRFLPLYQLDSAE